MAEIYLMRHGQVALHGPGYEGLSETGARQAQAAGGALARRGVRPSRLVVGTMLRHHESAQAASLSAGWSLPAEVDADWDEFDHVAILSASGRLEEGDAALRSEHTRRRMFEVALPRWASGTYDGEYPEGFAAFTSRALAALRRVAHGLAADDTAVVVTSGGIICSLAVTLAGGGRDEWLTELPAWVNGSITRVTSTQGRFAVVEHNDVAHLSGDLLTTR